MSEKSVPSVMNVEEVAEYLRLAPATVYRLANRGEIPGAKVGRVWRFQRATIEEWLTKQEASNIASTEATANT